MTAARWHTALLFVLLEALLLVSPGCRQQPEQEIFAVEGVLTVNGEPAANASLAFHPQSGHANPLCPVGRTDNQGRFRLTTHSCFDGAPAGDYAVTVVWLE